MDKSNIKARLVFFKFSKYWQVQTKLVFTQTVTYLTSFKVPINCIQTYCLVQVSVIKNMLIFMCMHISTVFSCQNIHMHTHAQECMPVHTHSLTHTQSLTYSYTHTHTHTCAYTHMHTHKHTHTHTYTHTHTHTQHNTI